MNRHTVTRLSLLAVLLMPAVSLPGPPMDGMSSLGGMSGSSGGTGMGDMSGMRPMEEMEGMNEMDMSMAGDARRGARIAQATCAACHGSTGVSASDELPDLAGQQAMYLMSSLMAYRSGRRSVQPMNEVAARLSARDMADVAAYYAGLESVQ